MTKNPCEGCPQFIFAESRKETVDRLEYGIELAERDLSVCGLKQFFNGRTRYLKNWIASRKNEAHIYKEYEPTLKNIQACKGPYVRIVEDTEAGFTWKQSYCGALVQSDVLTLRLDSDAIELNDDTAAEDVLSIVQDS